MHPAAWHSCRTTPSKLPSAGVLQSCSGLLQQQAGTTLANTVRPVPTISCGPTAGKSPSKVVPLANQAEHEKEKRIMKNENRLRELNDTIEHNNI